MSCFVGSSLVVRWIQTAATTTLSGDQRSMTYTPSVSLIDCTAGADTAKQYLVSLADATWTFNAVMQGGTASGGSITWATLKEGNQGTIEIMPEGTATGATKISVPSISMGVAYSWPYDNVCEVTVNGQQSGFRTEGTN